MGLEADGKWYLVPFGGWYVETEIAARNPAGPDPTTVLNRAVLRSFARDRIRISHRPAEAQQLPDHLSREGRAAQGRRENVDWSSVTLPSATPTPTYHRCYRHRPELPLPRPVRSRPPATAPPPRPRTPS